MDKDKNFYYQGKFFDTFDEMLAWATEFNKRQFTLEDFDSLFKNHQREVLLNLTVHEIKLTNLQLKEILDLAFLAILKETVFKKNSKND